jgi:hypothetical protein
MVIAVLAAAAPAAGQTAVNEGVWTAVSLGGKVSADSAWRWTADSLVQSRDGARTLDLALEHVMVTREMGQRVSIGFGYAVSAGFRNGGTLVEHRLTQLASWSGGVRRRVSLRSALEERFIAGRGAMLLRAREQVRVVWPIGAQHRLWGIFSEEVLVQADAGALRSLRLDGHRSFAGIGRRLTPGSAIEIGYLHAYATGGPNRRQTSHVLSASFTMSLPQGRRR